MKGRATRERWAAMFVCLCERFRERAYEKAVYARVRFYSDCQRCSIARAAYLRRAVDGD
jgi:hypothetical protein